MVDSAIWRCIKFVIYDTVPLLLQNHTAPHGLIQVPVLKIALGIIQKKYPELQGIK